MTIPLGIVKTRVKAALYIALVLLLIMVFKMSHYTGVHHVAFATGDMTLTVRYWRDLLGMPLVYSHRGPGYRQYFFNIHDRCRISFFEWSEVEKVAYKRHGAPVKGPFAFDHLSIGVTDKEALWELMARLDGADFPVSDVVDHGCFFSIYSFDPNGIPVEFSCDAPGLTLSMNPALKDEKPMSQLLTFSDPLPDQWPDPVPILPEEKILVPGDGKEHFPDPV